VFFDAIGVAAAVAPLPPLNARAAKKLPGAKQALELARNPEIVATFCNDVIGDISGIISGSAGAAIVFRLAVDNLSGQRRYLNIAMMAIVACITVGGKGLGKYVAINHAVEILMLAGKTIHLSQSLVPWKKAKPNGRNKRK
jgi:CBS domain containing-hemolysin-like protein